MRLAKTVRSVAAVLLLSASLSASALTQKETDDLLKAIDRRQQSAGDFKTLVHIESKEKGKADVVYELLVYRREAEEKLMLLFTKPKSEAGKGYLRLDKNLWLYDPSTGKWERRTERERVGGTDTRRADFDESRISAEYNGKWEGDDKLGAYKAHKIVLEAKDGVDVAFPKVRIWVDAATGNVLKRQEMALSGKLMRTGYFPKWKKIHSEAKKADVWFPEEMRFFDEVEKANSTVVFTRQVDLRPLPANMFTKAWLESRSR